MNNLAKNMLTNSGKSISYGSSIAFSLYEKAGTDQKYVKITIDDNLVLPSNYEGSDRTGPIPLIELYNWAKTNSLFGKEAEMRAFCTKPFLV